MVATISLLFGAYKIGDYMNGNGEETSFLAGPLRRNATTLREAAKGTGIYVGAAMNQRYMKTDSDYAALGAQEYSLLTEENACKMTQIASSMTDFDVTNCNYTANFAEQHGMAMRGHTLIWGAPTSDGHQHNPEFVNNETNATALEEFMVNYITTVMTDVPYPFVWDVVNEAVGDGPNQVMKTSPWTIIDDYICKAFTAARKANPNAQLFYNDYKHASMTGKYARKSDRVYSMIKNLTESGCPIDGVGFQSHIDIGYDDEHYAAVRKNIQRYNDIGIKVHFTEIDVRCNQTSAKNCPYNTTWSDEALEKQADIFNNLLAICLEEPNCMNFESWGLTDKYSSQPEPQNALPFDKEMNKKPAYYSLLSTLNQYNSTSSSAFAKLRQGNGEPKLSQMLQSLSLRF